MEASTRLMPASLRVTLRALATAFAISAARSPLPALAVIVMKPVFSSSVAVMAPRTDPGGSPMSLEASSATPLVPTSAAIFAVFALPVGRS
jgi:hypothetical protein